MINQLSIPIPNTKEIPMFMKVPNSFHDLFDLIQTDDNKEIIYSNTLDYLKDKRIEAYLQLLDIQAEAKQAGEYELSDSVINNAAKVLELVIKENIEIPHFSSNPAQQIGFTWNTKSQIVFLTVDDIGKLILTIMDLASQNNYLSSQCYMEDINDIVARVKNAL